MELILSIILFFSWLGCKKKLPEMDESHVQYINPEIDLACYEPSKTILQKVQSILPDGFISGYKDDQLEIVQMRLALIPNAHLKYLIEIFVQKKVKGIYPDDSLPEGVMGSTRPNAFGQTKSGTIGLIPSRISTTTKWTSAAMLHEIGHAVEIIVREEARRKNLDHDQSVLKGQKEAQQAGNRVRDYAKGSPLEIFAESYANYYCSRQSHLYLQKTLPEFYAYLSSVLPAPLWNAQ